MDAESASEITRLMSEHQVIYGIVADLDSGGVDTFGDKTKLRYKGLVQTLFGDGNSIRDLNASLEGQMMPQTWGQGEDACIVCKPAENFIVGLFYHEQREPAESYRFSKQLDAQIGEVWKRLNR
jgi:hypothetical protein